MELLVPKEFKVEINKVKAGTRLRCDAVFQQADPDCLKPFSVNTVYEDTDGDLYVKCGHGQHSLAGQISDCGKYYIGLVIA